MSEMEPENTVDQQTAPPRELTGGQRRVLGVLLEKGFTTPEYYPLTLKALTAGCNQKSNRDPVTNYSEERVEQYLDELRALGLVAVVHTESGRTERFRHYVRKQYPFSEPQLAIVTELLLRGRQQLGELRSRASRMVPIDSQDVLRTELAALQEQGFVHADGALERRGVEVDHAFYTPGEGTRQERVRTDSSDRRLESGEAASVRMTESTTHLDRIAALESTVADLSAARTQLTSEIETLKQEMQSLSEDLSDLRSALGS